ncbi:hypothetical protein PVK06_034695 [Gossypium arboreum]|uniref:Costars domain-containing protein n=1 Tax=Gossypium arboreum TaxID=29729 RepID=A0ABR0NEY4_GOSAR|nr:hypothetical protein PVK06_034695 [Gossypium arboreum]
MAVNSQQFQPTTEPTRRVHGLSTQTLEDKIKKLANVVQSLLAGKINPTRLYGIYAIPDHPTDLCLILHKEKTA